MPDVLVLLCPAGGLPADFLPGFGSVRRSSMLTCAILCIAPRSVRRCFIDGTMAHTSVRGMLFSVSHGMYGTCLGR